MSSEIADDELGVVFELTMIEYHAASRRVLAELGLTYAQLSDQAARRQFDNDSACRVWSVIGDSLPIDFV